MSGSCRLSAERGISVRNIFDSHAHYEDAIFGEDCWPVLDGLQRQGVSRVLNCCSDMGVVPRVLEIARRYDFVWASVGVHPHWTPETPADYLDGLRRAAQDPKVVAIGEIGLDYFWDDPKDLQMRIFCEQMELARELGLPVIIHDRDAHQDTYQVLERYRLPGVVHRFSGDLGGLRRVLDLGMYVSFGGDITHPQYRDMPLKAIEHTPLERILLETDAPYATPYAQGQRRCDSSMLPEVVEVIAGIKKISCQELCDITYQNACRAYHIPE